MNYDNRNGKTRGYYLPHELIAWLDMAAKREKRPVSNFLARIVENAKSAAGD